MGKQLIDYSAGVPRASAVKAAGFAGAVRYVSPARDAWMKGSSDLRVGIIEDMSVESWKPVLGWEGYYEVSDLGNVKTVARTAMRKNGSPIPVKERVLSQAADKQGRKIVCLKRGGSAKMRRVHTLVAEAFIEEVPEGKVVCHLDGNASNNKLSNLRVDTQSSNIYDSIEHGTHFNAGKTECPQGHEYTEENTTWYRNMRYCRACRRKAK